LVRKAAFAGDCENSASTVTIVENDHLKLAAVSLDRGGENLQHFCGIGRALR